MALSGDGGDRIIDWTGEFNSYVVPFAPFGAFTISRALLPQLRDYLYDLSEGDGAALSGVEHIALTGLDPTSDVLLFDLR